MLAVLQTLFSGFLIVLSVAAGSIVHFQLLAIVLLHSLLLAFEPSECRLAPRLGHDKPSSGFWNPHHHEQLHVAQMFTWSWRRW